MLFKNKYLYISFLAMLGLAGCKSVPMLPGIGAHKIDIQQGNAVTQEMVSKLQPGMTRSQVRFVLGTPLVVDPFRTDRWDYVYTYNKAGTLIEQRRLVVFFKEDRLDRLEGDVIAAKSKPESAKPAAMKPEVAKPAPAATPDKPETTSQPKPGAALPVMPVVVAQWTGETMSDAGSPLLLAQGAQEVFKPWSDADVRESAGSATRSAKPPLRDAVKNETFPEDMRRSSKQNDKAIPLFSNSGRDDLEDVRIGSRPGSAQGGAGSSGPKREPIVTFKPFSDADPRQGSSRQPSAAKPESPATKPKTEQAPAEGRGLFGRMLDKIGL